MADANVEVPTDPNKEVIWRELSIGIRDIYDHRQMTSERFMQLYTHVYNFCSKRPERTRAGTTTDELPFQGHDLYRRIEDLLKSYLKHLAESGKDKMGEDLLTFYLTEWERFCFSSKVLSGFCAYLNRHWNIENYKKRKEHTSQLYQLALDIWNDTVFETLHGPAVSTMLYLIKKDRNGESVNTGMVKGMNDAIVELGQDRNPVLYRGSFEDAFIAETKVFYGREASDVFQSGKSVSDYMKNVEHWLNEESRRAELYLHSSTMERLLRTCEHVLIEEKLSVLQEEFPGWLKAENTDDLGRMYDLVSKLGDSFLGTMRETLQTYITNEGSTAILQNRDQCNKDPREYVKTILDVYNKFHGLCNDTFKQDHGFIAALDMACRSFINRNALTSDGSYKSPEILAKYCNLVLRRGGKKFEGQDLEEMINQSVQKQTEKMMIFKFIEDKDVFLKYYSPLLANRLIQNLSSSDDAELFMISKLKVVCGHEYTAKLQRMVQDTRLAESMNDDFKKWLARQATPMKVNFNAMIVSSNYWPYSAEVNDYAVLPQVLQPCVNIFTQYYIEMHPSRKLNWLYNKSRGEVVSSCFQFQYTFVLSTSDMAVLLQYNEKVSYTLLELMEATQIKMDDLTQNVQLLLNAKLLKSDDDKDKLSPTSIIHLNQEYKNKWLKVNLIVPSKIEAKLEDERAQCSIEEGRTHEVQAAIVRIMKARKRLEHQQLLSETINLLRNRFAPSIKLIERCIENLIHKEYLQRSQDERNIYEYRI